MIKNSISKIDLRSGNCNVNPSLVISNNKLRYSDLKTPDALRAQLKAAIKNKSRPELEKAIIECEEAGFPELSLDLRLARDTLDGMGFGRGG